MILTIIRETEVAINIHFAYLVQIMYSNLKDVV